MLVHGKEVKRRDSKAGLVSQAATSCPLPSIAPLYTLAIAGLHQRHYTVDMLYNREENEVKWSIYHVLNCPRSA